MEHIFSQKSCPSTIKKAQNEEYSKMQLLTRRDVLVLQKNKTRGRRFHFFPTPTPLDPLNPLNPLDPLDPRIELHYTYWLTSQSE